MDNNYKNEILIIYKIELYSVLTNKDWTVRRTLSNFNQLHNALSKGFLNYPSFPDGIYINSRSSQSDGNNARLNLQRYLQQLLERAELINSSHLRQFLELENHVTDYMVFQPLLINEISTESMEVTSIAYSSYQNLLFAGFAYSSNTSTISSYFNSISSLFNNSYLGMINIYNMVKSSYGEMHTEKIYSESLTSQVSKIVYLEGENLDLLTVGLFDGHILIFRIYTNIQSYVSKNLVDLIAKFRPHRNKILDFGIESSVGYLYSAALNEKCITISEINYESVIKSVNISSYGLNNFYYEKENKRIFVTDISGSLWILQIEEYIIIKILQALHNYNQLPGLNCIRVEADRNFIFLGTNHGLIKFYDFEDEQEKNELKIYERLSLLTTDNKINDLIYTHSQIGLICALSNGSVAFWSHSEIYPEYVLDCHQKSVNKIIYDGNTNFLFTCSSDKTIKIWQLPSNWPSELMRQGTENEFLINERSIIEEYTCNKNNIFNLKNALIDIDIDKEKRDTISNEDINSQEIIVDTFNKNEIKKEFEEEDLIDSNYLYETNNDEVEDTFLDGWENETPLIIKNGGEINLLYNFLDN